MPSFLQFNPINRTIYGLGGLKGTYHLDVVISDFYERHTYLNIKLTVLQKINNKQIFLMYHLLIFLSAFLSLLVFMGYTYHLNKIVQRSFFNEEQHEKQIEDVNERFSDYHEVDIKFKKPQAHPIDEYHA